MTEHLRVFLEVGKKRRVVAAAKDWPGLDRWGGAGGPKTGVAQRGAPTRLDRPPRPGHGTRADVRKVEVRTPLEDVFTPDGLARHRAAYLDAIRAYNAEVRPAWTWPIAFLTRRTAQHAVDHAWELEGRA